MIGAGIAGVSCARALADAGHAVQLFDKSRGVGGRLASRRIEWVDESGSARQASFDHGAPGFAARSPEFTRFVQEARRAGWLSLWAPAIAPGSREAADALALSVPAPDMPSLCRRLLGGIPVRLSCKVDALRRDEGGWQVECEGMTVAEGFSRVVLALPPQQSAPLLQPHRADWAQQARGLSMLACWTLMGVAEHSDAAGWDLALPTHGPLSWITRNESKPGRAGAPGLAHWVAHATADWSRMHLEAGAADVQALLQAALADWLGHPVSWRHALVHRWRYASVPRANAKLSGRFRWDASLGLGVCGDAMGGAGVEGAWTSAQALSSTMISDVPHQADRHQPQLHRTGTASTLRPQALGGFPSSFPGLHNETSTS